MPEMHLGQTGFTLVLLNHLGVLKELKKLQKPVT